ncbi:MAG: hypothetical protein AAGC81_00350 [Pseudomonadota bacterium]
MTIQTLALGGDGGKAFEIEAIQEICVRSGERIDALLLNGATTAAAAARKASVHPAA